MGYRWDLRRLDRIVDYETDRAQAVAQYCYDCAGRCWVLTIGLLWLKYRDAGAGQLGG